MWWGVWEEEVRLKTKWEKNLRLLCWREKRGGPYPRAQFLSNHCDGAKAKLPPQNLAVPTQKPVVATDHSPAQPEALRKGHIQNSVNAECSQCRHCWAITQPTKAMPRNRADSHHHPVTGQGTPDGIPSSDPGIAWRKPEDPWGKHQRAGPKVHGRFVVAVGAQRSWASYQMSWSPLMRTAPPGLGLCTEVCVGSRQEVGVRNWEVSHPETAAVGWFMRTLEHV